MEEFKEIVGQDALPEDTISVNWNKWQSKVLVYASLSNKATIKELTVQRQPDIPNGKFIRTVGKNLDNIHYIIFQNTWEL